MAQTSFESLALRLDRLAEIAVKNAEKATRGAALVADQVLVLGTPVDTGRARGGWQVSFGAPDLTIPPIEQRDKPGAATIDKNRRDILTFRVGQELYISNAVPYIVFLDMGSSRQAPTGFSRRAALEAEAYLERFRYLPSGGSSGGVRDVLGRFI